MTITLGSITLVSTEGWPFCSSQCPLQEGPNVKVHLKMNLINIRVGMIMTLITLGPMTNNFYSRINGRMALTSAFVWKMTLTLDLHEDDTALIGSMNYNKTTLKVRVYKRMAVNLIGLWKDDPRVKFLTRMSLTLRSVKG